MIHWYNDTSIMGFMGFSHEKSISRRASTMLEEEEASSMGSAQVALSMCHGCHGWLDARVNWRNSVFHDSQMCFSTEEIMVDVKSSKGWCRTPPYFAWLQICPQTLEILVELSKPNGPAPFLRWLGMMLDGIPEALMFLGRFGMGPGTSWSLCCFLQQLKTLLVIVFKKRRCLLVAPLSPHV